MSKQIEAEIRYSEDGCYIFIDTDNDRLGSRTFQPDSPEYFTWLDTLKSFRFRGKEGWFTAGQKTKRSKTQKQLYWFAHRSINKQRFKKALGVTEKLSIAHLESIAQYFTDVCASQEVNELADILEREFELLSRKKPE